MATDRPQRANDRVRQNGYYQFSIGKFSIDVVRCENQIRFAFLMWWVDPQLNTSLLAESIERKPSDLIFNHLEEVISGQSTSHLDRTRFYLESLPLHNNKKRRGKKYIGNNQFPRPSHRSSHYYETSHVPRPPYLFQYKRTLLFYYSIFNSIITRYQ